MNEVRDSRARSSRLRVWRFGNACFDEAALTLTLDGDEADLERRPLELLLLLLSHAGEVVTKDEILDALWLGRDVSEASLTRCMARLRAGLGDSDHQIIRTMHGFGYRFAAPVTVAEAWQGATPLPGTAYFAAGMAVPSRPGWVLVRRLGAGGQGDAWLGENAGTAEPLSSYRVFKFAADGDGLSGLRREITLGRLLREALGPREDINRVLGWNMGSPPYFIEMAFHAHGSLIDWCASQGGAGAVPMATRLALVAQIADALSAAHGLGVLHKDIKPSNVLIRMDAAGAPCIVLTDFGSGRALEPARLEALGISRMLTEKLEEGGQSGTAAYLAPELSSTGAPTVKADVFALGVLLFQMATGDLRRPLAPGWEKLIESPLLREDIALAAAGDPAERLADVEELARRLRSLPVREAARGKAQEAEREAARLRRALELARARRPALVALVAVLVAGVGVSTSLFFRAERAQHLAVREAAQARADASRAKNVTRFLTEDVFSVANPALGADPNVPVRQMLGIAASSLQRRFPAGSEDRAAIEAAVGSAYAGLADQAHGMALLRSALATFRASRGEDDPQTQQVRLAMAGLSERMLDSDGMRGAGQSILDARPHDPAVALAARFYVLVGHCQVAGNAALCAEKLRPLFEETRSRLGRLDPLTLKMESELAARLGDAGHFDAAIPMARETAALVQSLYGPDNLLVLEQRFHLADTLVSAGQPDEAVGILSDARRRLRAIFGSETVVSARVENQLGLAYLAQHRYAESEQAFRAALDVAVKTLGRNSVFSQAIIGNIATMLVYSGQPGRAIPMAQEVLSIQRARGGQDDSDTLWAENNLADDYRRNNDLARAEALFRDILAHGDRVFTHHEADPGLFRFGLARVLIAEGKLVEARLLLTSSAAELDVALGPGNAKSQRSREALKKAGGDVPSPPDPPSIVAPRPK